MIGRTKKGDRVAMALNKSSIVMFVLRLVELKLVSSSSLNVSLLASPLNLPAWSYVSIKYFAIALLSVMTLPSAVTNCGAFPSGWVFFSSGAARPSSFPDLIRS